MRTWIFRAALAAAFALPLLSIAEPSSAEPRIVCGRDEAGNFDCHYVDENGDRWEPPPPPIEMEFTSDDRALHHQGSQCYGEYYSDPCDSFYNDRAPRDLEDFDDSLWAFETGASQKSHVRPDELHLEGNVYRGPDAELYSATAYSLFDVRFSVSDDAEFLLAYAIDGWPTDFFFSENDVRLLDWNTPDTRAETEMLLQLVAGRDYRLYFKLDSYDVYGYDGVDYAVTLSQVPEPGSALLLGVGVTLLAARRRR